MPPSAPEGGKKKKAAAEADGVQLMPVEKLQEIADAKIAEASAVELAAQHMSTSLELKIGVAIQKQKMSVADLLRKWDASGDGEIQPIELRQVVRNHLKIKADNKEIDALFNRLDSDGGGSIDLKEMGDAMRVFQQSVATAAADEAKQMAIAKELRDQAAMISDCAKNTARVEELRVKVNGIKSGVCSGPLFDKIAMAIVGLATSTNESDAKSKVANSLDPQKAGIVEAKEFKKWAKGFINNPDGVAPDEYATCYEDLQVATGTSPLDAKMGFRKLWDRVEETIKESEAVIKEFEKLQKETKKVQKAIKEMQVADKAIAQEKEAAALKAEEERQLEAEAKKAAKAAAKAAALEAKRNHEQSFNNRVEMKRKAAAKQGQSASDKKAAEARMRKAFAVFDVDGDGSLTVDELKAVLLRGDSVLTEQDVEDLVKEFDANGNGVLEFDEVMRAVSNPMRAHSRRSPATAVSAPYPCLPRLLTAAWSNRGSFNRSSTFLTKWASTIRWRAEPHASMATRSYLSRLERWDLAGIREWGRRLEYCR